MNDAHQLLKERIQKAAAALRALRPEYGALLSFYEQLFITQERAKIRLFLEPILIAPDLLRLKRQQRLPLVELPEFVFDAAAGKKLLLEICRITQGAETEMAISAARIESAAGKDIDIESLFRNLLSDDDAYFQNTSERLGCDRNTLAFLAYNSLKPAVMTCAEQLAGYLSDQTDWEKGTCPVCGHLPAIGLLGREGRRSMVCSFCWHQWPLPRLFCPFCDNTDSRTLSYLFSEGEKPYRLDCCEQCGRYTKVVDTRTANRAVYPALEQVASLHLDIKARQAGFKPGIAIHLPDT